MHAPAVWITVVLWLGYGTSVLDTVFSVQVLTVLYGLVCETYVCYCGVMVGVWNL